MILNYFDLAADFGMTPDKAVAYFADKGLKASFHYLDMEAKEHDAAFTVAKMMDTDLLATVRDKVDRAIADGTTLDDFKRSLIPQLQQAGWWGKQDQVDPKTGKVVKSQLGSASRLETIFRTNIQSAYSVGHWEQIQAQAKEAPYLMYDAIDDNRTRPAHAAMDNTVLPVDARFWDTHFPPNGYNCRCSVIQMDHHDLADHGLSVSPEPNLKMRNWTNPRTGKTKKVPEGVDPQFAHNPGKVRLASLKVAEAEKAAQLAKDEQRALDQSKAAIEKARAASRDQSKLKAAIDAAIKQGTKGAYAAHKAKQANRAAQAEIDKAIANKTPYLATAIKQVQAKKYAQGMTPTELLKAAKDKAEANKTNAYVADYKAAKIKEKEPSKKAQDAFNSLPETKQQAITQEIEVKTGNYQAKQQIEQYKTAQGHSYEKKAIKKLENQGALKGKSPKEQLAAINQAADEQKAKDQQAKAVKAYKQKLIDGKKPTENQAQAFNALTDSEQQALLDEVDATKAKAQPKPKAPAAATTGPHMDAITKVGTQKGSNPGGTYLDTNTGKDWYIKTPASEDNARNEVLAAKLYHAAGVEVPEIDTVTLDGKPAVASQIIDGLKNDPQALQDGKVAHVGDAFAIDAWLANWDVVGLNYDNLLIKDGRAVRVDTGGALRYRAQGGLKGAAFGDTVNELETLRDPGLNPQAAAVFKNVTDDQIKTGVERIAKIDDQQIDDLVAQYGPTDAAEQKALAQTLKARRDDLMARYHVEPPGAPKATPKAEGVTKGEADRIKNARQNGYAVPTDKDQIEDQQVLYWTETTDTGKPRTHAQLKLRGKGLATMEKAVADAGAALDLKGDLDQKVLAAIKGIAGPAQAEGLRQKDIDRAKAALFQYKQALADIDDAINEGSLTSDDRAGFTSHYQKWMTALLDVANGNEGDTVQWPPAHAGIKAGENFSGSSPLAPKAKAGALNFVRQQANAFTRKEIKKGHVIDTGKPLNTPDYTYYEGSTQGMKLRFWGPGAPQALRGRLEIIADGEDQGAANNALKALDQIGVDTSRPSNADTEELYLRQIAYHRNDVALINATEGQPQDERIKQLKDALSKGLPKPIDQMPEYNPEGVRQAFDEGFVHRYRPDLPEKEWQDFQRDYRLYHANTGGRSMADMVDSILNAGGKMAPTTDKMRRGIPIGGMSPTSDLNSGGAHYFFTRIRSAKSHSTGLYWKAKHIARLDAISYDHDAFGRTSDGYVQNNRKTGIDQWKKAAGAGGNETILKDGISLFDGLDRIVAESHSEQQAIIKTLKDHGYNTWPDGRPLDEVITLK